MVIAFLGRLIGSPTFARLADSMGGGRPVMIVNKGMIAVLAILSGFVGHAIIKMIYLPEAQRCELKYQRCVLYAIRSLIDVQYKGSC